MAAMMVAAVSLVACQQVVLVLVVGCWMMMRMKSSWKRWTGLRRLTTSGAAVLLDLIVCWHEGSDSVRAYCQAALLVFVSKSVRGNRLVVWQSCSATVAESMCVQQESIWKF